MKWELIIIQETNTLEIFYVMCKFYFMLFPQRFVIRVRVATHTAASIVLFIERLITVWNSGRISAAVSRKIRDYVEDEGKRYDPIEGHLIRIALPNTET